MPDDAALVWLLEADAVRVTVADAATAATYLVRPAAALRDWIGLTARPEGRRHPDGTDPWGEIRYVLLALYPELVGRN